MRDSDTQNSDENDAKRYMQRLWRYIPAFENIIKILFKLESNELISLIGEMLPFLSAMFNSEVAFLTDQEGKIIKARPKINLEGKFLPKIVMDETNPSKKPNDPVFAWNGENIREEFQKLDINSIMVIISQTDKIPFWIGVCNGQGISEPYLGEDKKIFKFILSYFHLIYNSGHKSGQESEELKECKEKYLAAFYDRNWADLERSSADLVIKYKDENALADFLDASLCEKIRKKSLNQENKETKKVENFDLDEENRILKIRITSEKKSYQDIEIPFEEKEKVALAGVRSLLYDFFIDSKTFNNKDIEDKNYLSKIEKIYNWINFIAEKSSWNDKENKDFDYRIDWLRTQWLRIYYQTRSEKIRPKVKKDHEIKTIYGKTWRKTLILIQEHLKSSSGQTRDYNSLIINSDWLLSFLAQNALLSRELAEHYELFKEDIKNSNRLTVSRFFLHLSKFILYILYYIRFAQREKKYELEKEKLGRQDAFRRPPFTDVPITPDTSLSSSIIFIISEYAYREIGVPRELLIFEKLSQQLNFELPLYAANEFYRDHCYHMIDVCLIGEFLLSCHTPGLINKSGKIIFNGLNDINRENSLKNWYIAALCHDLGYVVERAKKLVGPIEKLKSEGLLQFNHSVIEGLNNGKEKLKKDIDSLCCDVNLSIQDELKNKIKKRIETLDHGIISWLYLCQILKKLEIPLSSMKSALTAILRHNMSEHDENIHVELLSLLLILCDHLQEWGRPRVVTDQLATGVMEIMRFSQQESYFTRQVHLNQFSINGMTFENPLIKNLPEGICDKCINKKICNEEKTCLRLWSSIGNEGITFRLVYYGDQITDFEPVITWLLFCQDFQCKSFPFGQYLFPIAIHFSHPPSIRPLLSESGVSELDIFEEFANTNEEAAYLCQWIECARKRHEGIEYKREYDQVTEKFKDEEFIIHLESLGRPLSRGIDSQQIKDFVKWKKEWWARKSIAQDFRN